LNDLASVERLVRDKTVAVMLEPIQGEAGVFVATDAFLRDLRALTSSRGLLLIVDEVQTGIGRTGRLYGYEHAGIEPDIMTLGKGIGGGVPLAALLAKQAVCCFEHGDQGGTFNGNSLMTAAGQAVLEEVLKPGFLTNVQDSGEYLARALQALASKHELGEVRGRGLLLALDLRAPVGSAIVEKARDKGVLLNSPRPDSLRFMPALNITRTEIDTMITVLDTTLAEVKAAAAEALPAA
jgi:acetylornithine/N-succinyldiaminopimelate aminotransferase